MKNILTGKERQQLEGLTLRQLRKIASEYNIFRYSRKRKQELLSAIEKIMRSVEAQVVESINQEETMEPSKFDINQEESIDVNLQQSIIGESSLEDLEKSLPGGYGDKRIVLMPRDSQWAYAYWDIANEYKQELVRQGGQTLILRLYDVTKIDINLQVPHSVQEYPCDELAREWYLPVPVSNRDYIVEIGYRSFEGNWLILARSIPVRIPPVYPSQWVEDVFVTVNWEEDLRGKTVHQLVSPEEHHLSVYKEHTPSAVYTEPTQYPEKSSGSEAVQSSYVLAEGVGDWSLPTVSGKSVSSYVLSGNVSGLSGQVASSSAALGYSASGVGVSGYSGSAALGYSASGVGVSGYSGSAALGYSASGVGVSGYSGSAALGYSASGVGVSGYSGSATLGYSASGIGMLGFSASAIPERPRKFWLVADAELIVYGATEPDATVTIGGRPIKLNEDGTFRFQMSFQDGLIDYPIMAVAVDGEQTRSIHMKFNRETPSRRTNTKEEAILEWF